MVIKRFFQESGGEAPNIGSWERRLAISLGYQPSPGDHGSWARRALLGVDADLGPGSWGAKLRRAIRESLFGGGGPIFEPDPGYDADDPTTWDPPGEPQEQPPAGPPTIHPPTTELLPNGKARKTFNIDPRADGRAHDVRVTRGNSEPEVYDIGWATEFSIDLNLNESILVEARTRNSQGPGPWTEVVEADHYPASYPSSLLWSGFTTNSNTAAAPPNSEITEGDLVVILAYADGYYTFNGFTRVEVRPGSLQAVSMYYKYVGSEDEPSSYVPSTGSYSRCLLRTMAFRNLEVVTNDLGQAVFDSIISVNNPHAYPDRVFAYELHALYQATQYVPNNFQLSADGGDPVTNQVSHRGTNVGRQITGWCENPNDPMIASWNNVLFSDTTFVDPCSVRYYLKRVERVPLNTGEERVFVFTSSEESWYSKWIGSGSPVKGDVLVVAGGGGGNRQSGAAGGGGAGGLRWFENVPLTGTEQIVIGPGGAGRGTSGFGSNGGSSSFGGVIAGGGGGGGGLSGGSGGGSWSSGTGGLGTTGQGNNGETSTSGGGGGGASDPGGAVAVSAGGEGRFFDWLTAYGDSGWFAGGGNGSGGAGAALKINGGGSTGGSGTRPNAIANSGGGGGGSNGGTSGNGGSGIVVVRVKTGDRNEPATSYRDLIVADSPISYWRLGETSGTVAVDEMAFENGVYSNSPTLGVAGVTDDGDTAVTFNGTNQQMSVAYRSAWNTSALTVEAWIKTTATGVALIVSRDNGTNGHRDFQFRIDAGKVQFVNMQGNGVGATTVASAGTVNDGAWHHVVAVRDGSTVTLYIDGVQDGHSTAMQAPHLTGTSRIAVATNANNAAWLAGTLDEVAYYGTALAAARVAAHHTAGI
jgi:hypothetical protein